MLPKPLQRRWRIHEQTQRLAIRALFLFFAVVPTLFVFGMVVVVRSAWYQKCQANSLSKSLTQSSGLVFAFDQFVHPAPNLYVLKNLRAYHPETGQELLRARLTEASFKNSTWYVRVSQPEVITEQIASLWGIIHDRILCSPQADAPKWQWSMSELAFLRSPGVPTIPSLVDVTIATQSGETDTRASMQFRPVMESNHSFVRIDISRQHSASVPYTQLELDTVGHQLPINMLADLFPTLDPLGPTSQFSGSLISRFDSRGNWSLHQQGTISQVRLETLTSRLPFGAAGEFDILSYELFMDNQCIRRISGIARSNGSGQVSNELLTSAELLLGSRIDKQVRAKLQSLSNKRVKYDDFAFQFVLNNQGLTLQGNLPAVERMYANEANAIIVRDENTWLFNAANPSQVVPLENVVRWLNGGMKRYPGDGTANGLEQWFATHLPWTTVSEGIQAPRVSSASGPPLR